MIDFRDAPPRVRARYLRIEIGRLVTDDTLDPLESARCIQDLAEQLLADEDKAELGFKLLAGKP